ncbi:site-2 protease family protein [Rubrivivax gelatinosus]|uniref:site-2 protease family protein n=1 Tax=Rubrivivax gelatinosus TaxID=28068 RepID=UPI0002E7411A|nr:site-2 protease family protein [Rubrivivax gelatinosus]MBG6083093.1 membrane-associated protease RseP (regulator of RpoE activity) [Rubrivivax gelatinosus]
MSGAFIALALAFSIAATWAVIIGLLALHEWGHLFAMRKLGLRADKVVLGVGKLFAIKHKDIVYEFGLLPVLAYCVSKDFERTDTNRRAWVALAGPAATAITGLMFLGLWAATGYWLARACAQGSLILFLTNIIPLPPLDGWTVAEHFLHKRGIKLSQRERKALFVIGAVTIVAVALIV